MLRFTIRDLLLVTLVVAMGVGWWLDHRNQAAAVDYYTAAYKQWRIKAGAADEVLASFGFEIKEGFVNGGHQKSYNPPPGLMLDPAQQNAFIDRVMELDQDK